MLDFLKKWWKLIAGFLVASALFLWNILRRRERIEFHENAIKNLEGQIEAEKDASLKMEEAKKKAETDLEAGSKDLDLKIEEKRKNLIKEKEKSEAEIVETGIGKAIADLLDAELVEPGDE